MLDVFRKMADFKLTVHTYNCWIVPEPAFQNLVYLINNLWILTDMFYTWKEYSKYLVRGTTFHQYSFFGGVINAHHKYTISIDVCTIHVLVI